LGQYDWDKEKSFRKRNRNNFQVILAKKWKLKMENKNYPLYQNIIFYIGQIVQDIIIITLNVTEYQSRKCNLHSLHSSNDYRKKVNEQTYTEYPQACV